MPQRSRPRLKQMLITCSWCKGSAVKLYPSRESVRRKLPEFRFCSSTCQRDHWEARRKSSWNVPAYPCLQCGELIIPLQIAGRRRSYCDDACKAKAARARLRRQPSGAVAAAREKFAHAWLLTVHAANSRDEFAAFGQPVHLAVQKANKLWPFAYTDQDKMMGRKPICEAIYNLAGPRHKGEPARQPPAEGRFEEWHAWWKAGLSSRRLLYEHRVVIARAATVELHKHERVAARRAETARLRRAAA